MLAGKVRTGANLYTCSIVALNADTGKMAWYFQASPHDTEDRDANESIALIDGNFKGKPRKLLAQAGIKPGTRVRRSTCRISTMIATFMTRYSSVTAMKDSYGCAV